MEQVPEHSVNLLNELGIIVGVAIFTRWLAWKIKTPAIILLILAGLLVGPVFNFINPQETFASLYYPIIEIAIAIILFEGGLNLKFHEFKSIASGISRLISLGITLNWILGTLAAHYLANLSWSVSFVISAILVVTGPTVIIPAIRQARLDRKVGQYLKWEGIINDPLGVLLATLAFEFVIYQGSSSLQFIFVSLLKVLFLAFVLSAVFGLILKLLIQKSLIPDFLKVPVILAAVIVLYVLSSSIYEGSGLLAATLLGIFFGNQDLKFSTELSKFKESISIFAISVVFILLSSSLDFVILERIDFKTFGFILLVSFVTRPVALLLSTVGSSMAFKERLLVSLYGPRGIVAASMAGILGVKLSAAGYEGSEMILPIVFAIIFLTVLVSGFSLEPIAKALKLSVRNSHGLLLIGASPWVLDFARKLKELKIPVLIVDSSSSKLKDAMNAGIDCHCGEILTDLDEGKIDLTKYNYAFAVTYNDSFNALVCEKLSEDFERSNLFQLPIHGGNTSLDELPESLGGTPLDQNKALYENLLKRHYESWEFVSNEISPSFSFADLITKYKDSDAIHFLLLHKDQKLDFLGLPKNADPQDGDIVISYTPGI